MAGSGYFESLIGSSAPNVLGHQHCQPSPLSGESISNLLLQRSVQTMATYFSEFKDEPKAEWVARFGDPGFDLGCEALSDTEVRPKFHGLDALCEMSVDYMRELSNAEPFVYQVRYKVGTPYGAPAAAASGAPDGFAETAQAGMDLWGLSAGAASRRRNPYLQDAVRYIEYEETIDPGCILSQLKAVRLNLAEEFQSDIKALIRQARAGDERPHLRDDGDSSPLRRSSVDLCERLATREAAITLLTHELGPAAGKFLGKKLKGQHDTIDDMTTTENEHLSLAAELAAVACRLNRRDVLGDHYRAPGLSQKFLEEIASTPAFLAENGIRVKPSVLAKRLERARCDILEMWADSVIHQVQSEHQFLDKLDALENQVKSKQP